MVEEVTDRVHVAEVLAVLVDRLEHLIEGHADLKPAQGHAYTETNKYLQQNRDKKKVFKLKKKGKITMHIFRHEFVRMS